MSHPNNLKGKTPEGREFEIHVNLNPFRGVYLEWKATDEIGPINIPVKDTSYGDLYFALCKGRDYQKFLKV